MANRVNVLKIEVDDQQAKKKIQDVGQAVESTTQATEDNTQAVEENNQANSSLDDVIDSLPGPLADVAGGFRDAKDGIGQATKAALRFLATPLGAVLGAIGVAVAALTSFFRDSVKGQEAFARISAVTSAVLGKLKDVLINVGGVIFNSVITGFKAISSAVSEPKRAFDSLVETLRGVDILDTLFDDPIQGLKEFALLIKDELVERFQATLDFFQNGGQILSSLFTIAFNKIKLAVADVPIIGKAIDKEQVRKNIKGATEQLKDSSIEAVNNFARASVGIENATGKIKKGIKTVGDVAESAGDGLANFFSSVGGAAGKADELAQAANQLARDQRQFSIDESERQKEIAQLKLNINKEDEFSLKERIKFAEQAAALEQENLAEKERLAKEELRLVQAKNALGKGTIEDLDREAELKVTLNNIQEESLGKQEELQGAINTLKNEDKSLTEQEIKAQDKKLRQKQDELDKQEKLEDLKAQGNNEDLSNEQRINSIQKALELELQLLEAQKERNQATIEELELKKENGEITAEENERLFEAKEREKDLAEKTEEVKQEATQKTNQIKSQELTQEEKAQQTLAEGAKLAKTVFGEKTAAAKAANITQAVTNTYTGATRALKDLPPPASYVAAATTIATGLASVAKITAAAGGGDFVTNGPAMMMVGDNPGGRERVSVTPLSGTGKTTVGDNISRFAGGGTLTTDGGTSAFNNTQSTSQALQSQKNIQDSINKMPTPVVSVKDIVKVQNRVQVRDKTNNF